MDQHPEPKAEVSNLLLESNNDYESCAHGKSSLSVNDSIRDSIGMIQDSIPTIFNLTKNLVGAGAFGIPSGFAALAGASRSGWAMVPAGIIIAVMAMVFGYYFILIGRLCKMLGASSYGDCWHESAAKRGWIWKKVSFCVPLSVIGMAGLGNVAYSMILADATRELLAGVGYSLSRSTCLLMVTVLVLLPLCMVKEMSVLAPFSAVGTGGIIFTMIVMAWRCFDGSYDSAKGGDFLSSTPIDLQPFFESYEPVVPAVSDVFLLLCMCFQAFFSHYNAPRYYTELKPNSIPRFSFVTKIAFGFSAVIYFVIGSLGYYTFGQNSNGFILNNYSANDNLVSICRFAIAVSLAFTYPLPFIGVRDGILDLFSVHAESLTSTNLNILSVAILSVFTALACHFTDLGLLNAAGGGFLGTFVVFIFPSIMFYAAVKNQKEASFSLKCESVLCLVLMLGGTAVGFVGVMQVVA